MHIWQKTLVVLGLAICVFTGIVAVNYDKPAPEDRDPDGLAQAVQSLNEHIQRLESENNRVAKERDGALDQVQTLQNRLVVLDKQRKADQQVVQQLWDLVTDKRGSTSKLAQLPLDPNSPADNMDDRMTDSPEETTVGYDFQAVKDIMLAAEGDVDTVIHEIITQEGIERMLSEYGDQPVNWVTASRLAADPQTAIAYLEEGIRRHPESPAILSALVQAQIQAGTVDESTLVYVSELERVDPTNALGDCYTAHCQFTQGDIQGALQSLSEASAKGRFADGQIEGMLSRYDYLLNEGVSDGMALSMSFFSMPTDQWSMIRQVALQSLDQVRVLTDTGQYDSALRISQDVASLGSMISSSGRFFMNDLIGISLQKAGLNQQKEIHTILEDTPQVQAADERIAAINERTAQMKTMGRAFGDVMDSMTEDDLAGFVDGAILNGEFATMQEIPEVSDALVQARVVAESEEQAVISSQVDSSQ